MTRPMFHEDSTLPVHAYLDGELDPTNALAVEERMATDPALAAECARIDALQRLVREHLPREAPPPGLRTRVETAVGMRRPRARFADTQFSWRALAASIAVAAVVSGSATSMLRAPSPSDMVRGGIVDAHIRSLMASTGASPRRHGWSILPSRISRWSAAGSTSSARSRCRRWSMATASISSA